MIQLYKTSTANSRRKNLIYGPHLWGKGRNARGIITAGHRGGGDKVLYSKINFKELEQIIIGFADDLSTRTLILLAGRLSDIPYRQYKEREMEGNPTKGVVEFFLIAKLNVLLEKAQDGAVKDGNSKNFSETFEALLEVLQEIEENLADGETGLSRAVKYHIEKKTYPRLSLALSSLFYNPENNSGFEINASGRRHFASIFKSRFFSELWAPILAAKLLREKRDQLVKDMDRMSSSTKSQLTPYFRDKREQAKMTFLNTTKENEGKGPFERLNGTLSLYSTEVADITALFVVEGIVYLPPKSRTRRERKEMQRQLLIEFQSLVQTALDEAKLRNPKDIRSSSQVVKSILLVIEKISRPLGFAKLRGVFVPTIAYLLGQIIYTELDVLLSKDPNSLSLFFAVSSLIYGFVTGRPMEFQYSWLKGFEILLFSRLLELLEEIAFVLERGETLEQEMTSRPWRSILLKKLKNSKE